MNYLESATHGGQCLCGGVKYVVHGPLRHVHACHCTQCRQTSGNFVAATNAPTAAIEFAASDSLRWYKSSETAERGFCTTCGGNLFWRQIGGDTTSIMAGTLDAPTGLKTVRHIFVADKSDYYSIDDGAPQLQGWS